MAALAQSIASTVSENVFERLREDLKSNLFPPGDRLKVEEMRDKYDVSIGPLREALFRLVGLGLVTQIGQKGFRAAAISRDDAAHIVANRKFLESRAFELSLRNGDDEWESNVVAAFHLLKKATRVKPQSEQDYLSWERHHTEFHYALVSGCGSSWLVDAWKTVFDQAERYRRLAMKRGHWIIDQKADHEHLMKAAIGRDFKAGLAILERHIGRSIGALMT
jgi:GntR family transcriptional regulator, carbon starvation induced regulator